MKIASQGTGRMFDKTIYMGEGNEGTINLRLVKGEAVVYGKNAEKIIDFPGEYDMSGTSIKCIEADKKLHYVITTDDETLAILQTSAALEVTNFEAIDTWLCRDASIKEEIERLEMDGDITVLGEETTIDSTENTETTTDE